MPSLGAAMGLQRCTLGLGTALGGCMALAASFGDAPGPQPGYVCPQVCFFSCVCDPCELIPLIPPS